MIRLRELLEVLAIAAVVALPLIVYFWESNGKILASNEVLKRLCSFDNFENTCNWFMAHNAGIARRFYKQWKAL